MNLGWIVIITNLALTYFMGIVVFKEIFDILKNLIKYSCKLSLRFIASTQISNKIKNSTTDTLDEITLKTKVK